MEITPKTIAMLKKLAEQGCWYDNADFRDGIAIVEDYVGGNVDDAFSSGETAGEVRLARTLLEDLGVEFKYPEEDE